MLLSSVNNLGLFQILDKICSSTTNTFPIKDKIAYLNEALDWYCRIAFRADNKWNFDDLNETSPPIDTQNIVSGTNRYKMSAFTEKIINLLKLEILDANGVAHSLIPETLDSFGNVVGNASGSIGDVSNQSFQSMYVNAASGMPTHYLKYGDFIYLRPKPNYSLASALLALLNRAANKFEFVGVTVVAGTDLFTSTAHGLVAGDTVIFETDGTIPTGLTADRTYFVISTGLTANDFKVSATLGGASVDVTDAQTGSNHSFLKTSAEPGIIAPDHWKLARKSGLIYRSLPGNSGNPDTLGSLFQQVLMDEKDIGVQFGQRDQDLRKRLSVNQQNNK